MEHEIRKHVRIILNEIADKKKSFWKKVLEIGLEVVIIVFAVSFAVFMERNREHQHDKTEAKEFLLGLKTDLQNDIKEMTDDRTAYAANKTWLTYFGDYLSKDTIQKYRYQYKWVIGNNIQLLANKGRYEGFKASGKMNTISNTALRNNILDLYEESLAGIYSAWVHYNNLKQELQRLTFKMQRTTANGDNLAELLQDPEIKNYCQTLGNTNTIIIRYDSAIVQSKRIVSLIDKEYPAKH